MSILGRQRILEIMKHRELKHRLVVTPILDSRQVGEGSIDIRLGNEFIVVRRGNLPLIDPAENVRERRAHTKHFANFGRPFYLHPNELVLASSLEYVRLPANVSAYVTSRSRWGRVGLVIATATAVHPGFTGCITLELVNHGEVPLALYPGSSVAQLVLSEIAGAGLYSGHFAVRTGPLLGGVSKDDVDLEFWTNRNSHS